MPPFEAFRDAESYYSTLAHELTHWTKHPQRLDRDFDRKKWGDEGYSREELVAELGSAFLCADLELTPDHVVARLGVSADVDALDIGARALLDRVNEIDDVRLGVTVSARTYGLSKPSVSSGPPPEKAQSTILSASPMPAART